MNSHEQLKTIGQRVKAYRKNKGLSQDELAEGICSRQTISLLENEQHIPSADFLKKISARLGIPFHEMMINQVSELEINVQLDMIRVYLETGDYLHVIPVIESLEMKSDILQYQQRELSVCKAECLMRTGRADDAIVLLTKLQEDLEQQRDPDEHFIATVLDKIGTAYYFRSNMIHAHSHYLRAYQICRRFPEMDLLYSKVSYNMGNVCIDLGHYSEALGYLEEAHRFFAKASDPQKLATTLFALGLVYHALNDLEQSGSYLKQALELFRSQNIISMAQRIKQQYAFYVLAPQEPEKALMELMDCVKEFQQSGDKIREAYTLANIASLYMEQGVIDKAGDFILQSVSLFSLEDAHRDFRLAYIYRTFSRYLIEIKEFEKAIEYSFISSEIFDKMGIERESANSLRCAVDAHQFLGNLSEALSISQRVIGLLTKPNTLKNQL